MTSPIILVDGSSYFFRAFHALPPLTNSKGQATGAIYGVVNMVRRLIKDYQPTQLAVIFDAKGKTFRDEWYPEYKANRPAMPSELSSQFEPLLDLLDALGIPLFLIDGVEADDVIGTFAQQATELGLSTLISTGDKDMAQLVNQHVTLINTMTNQILDETGVYHKFGVQPSQIIDYLSLVGDTSDNVPGVTKCGPKTASKWLNEYVTLDNIIAQADTFSGKIGEHLRASLAHLPLSKKLVTIKTDVDLPCRVDALFLKPIDQNALLQKVQALEFKSWVKELLTQMAEKTDTAQPLPSKTTVTIVNTSTQLQTILTQLEQCSLVCVDLETTSLDPLNAEIVGIALAIDPTQPVYIPVAHEDNTLPQLPRDTVLNALKPFLENEQLGKLGQNIKYDYAVFKNNHITLQGILFDTMLESYLLNSAGGNHDMDSLALKYLGYKTISYKEVTGHGANALRFDQVPIEKAAPYAGEDAEITYRLHQTIYPLMAPSVQTVLQEVEIPLVTVIADMEYQGVLIDEIKLKEQGERLKTRIQSLEQEAFSLAGKTFNLNSPKQLLTILYEEQALPVLAKTPTGQPSTAEAVLQDLAYQYRLPAVIVEYRQLSKLLSTYIDALPKQINPRTQRVHTSYNQAVTTTGRLSSSNPNLQNIPVRTEEGRMIRQAFIAPLDHQILAADYSQIELRIMAHLSQDKNLLLAFNQGLDIHTATASEIFSTPLDLVTFEQRRRAKAINFGLIYGMSAFGLSKQLGIERHDAQQYIDRYFERYPAVLHYMENTRAFAREKGYVETLFGRRLYVPEINAQNHIRRKAAERAAINAPMQGTAADIIKKAMLAIAVWQKQQSEPIATMIMQVHDELVFEVKTELLPVAADAIRTMMEKSVLLSVPLEVSIGTGANWDEAH